MVTILVFILILFGTEGFFLSQAISQSNQTFPPLAKIEIEGTIVDVKKVPGFGRRQVTWWAIDVQTDEKVVEVRIAPTWWYSNLNLKRGDTVKIIGYKPPYWVWRNIEAIMSCKVEDLSTGNVYDFFNTRRACQRLK